MTNKDLAEPIYPCQFPIKVIGENKEDLEKTIIKVMSSFGEVINPDEIAIKHSKNKKYLSITFVIVARSREYIEQIYSELHAQKEVKMVM
ncbi:MAG: HP0495 family protein [Desulfuromonadaceae bacterium]